MKMSCSNRSSAPKDQIWKNKVVIAWFSDKKKDIRVLTKIQNIAYVGIVVVVIEGLFFKEYVPPFVDSVFTYLLIVFLVAIPIIGYIKRKKNHD